MKFNKDILIIGKVWPEPNSSAAGLRMMQLINFFLKEGITITFASTANKTDFQEDITKKGIKCVSIQLNDDSFDEFISKLQPSTVLFDRFMVEEQFGWRVSLNAPEAIKILNTEDLHFLRDARKSAVKNNGEFDVKSIRSEMAMRELVAIQRCDLSLFVSQFEVDLLVDDYSIPKERLAYVPIFAERENTLPSFEDRKDFMFIGNFYHEPNWDAVQILKKEIWPIIRKSLPDVRLLIYGAYAGQKVSDFNNETTGFVVKGRAENASEVTKSARVSLSPLRFGAGIKGKLLEAMQNGTPSVTTSIGTESMKVDDEWGGFVEDDFEGFAQKSIELYQSKDVWQNASQVGFDILKNRFGKNTFEVALSECLERTQNDFLKTRSKDLLYKLFNHHSVKSSMYLSRWIDIKNKTTLD